MEKPQLFNGEGLFGAAGADPCTSSARHSQQWRGLGGYGSHMEGSSWQVVYPGLMNVRSAKLYLSRMLGKKANCLMVLGKREDNWVRLQGEPGYMMISLNGTILMEETPVTYELVEQGSCEEAGRHPIRDFATCQASVWALGLPGTEVKMQTNTQNPDGCYVHGNSVFLSTDPSSIGNIADGARQLVCSSHATPQRDPCQKRAMPPRAAGPTASDVPVPERPQSPGQSATTASLFCFTVVEVTGYGPELMVVQMENGAGVFSCDTSVVYSIGKKMPLTPGWNTTMISRVQADAANPMKAETLTYMEAWDAVVKDQRFETSDWIVKVAPETVFFADRLRKKLEQHPPAQGKSLFFLNCKKDAFGEPALLGSVEVFSRGALEAYRGGNYDCRDLPWQGWGENTYIQQCLEMLNVGSVLDGDMVGDSRCEPAPCSDVSKVAFHDYKNASSYLKCWEEAMEVAMASDFIESMKQ